LVRIGYRLAVAVVVFAGFLSPAKGGPVFNGPYPNPNSLNQPNGYYVVAAQDAQADPSNWNDDLGTPAQLIQRCMNAQLTNAGKQANWPLPVQGAYIPNLSFTANTQAQPNNYSAYSTASQCGAQFQMTAQNMPAGEHWLQLVYSSYLATGEPAASTWPDPSGRGYWGIDNGVEPGQPFYDLSQDAPPGSTPPSFSDVSRGPWSGMTFFQAYLFVADMDASNVITLHDVVTWGWSDPKIDPTPEPATFTLALVGSGTLGLFGYLRRRKKETCINF
jgi:hypothetical protein